jgi:DNA-binding response OmpR family regulator
MLPFNLPRWGDLFYDAPLEVDESPGYMKKNVLIADDDLSVRESLGKVLKEVGYNVVEAADGAEAIEEFKVGQVDLLLLDIGLPVRDGWDVFESITSRAPALPIIIITGSNNQYDTAVAASVGALMEKPLDVVELLKTIQELLTEPQETRLRRFGSHSHEIRYIPPARPSFREKLHS